MGLLLLLQNVEWRSDDGRVIVLVENVDDGSNTVVQLDLLKRGRRSRKGGTDGSVDVFEQLLLLLLQLQDCVRLKQDAFHEYKA